MADPIWRAEMQKLFELDETRFTGDSEITDSESEFTIKK